jgi:hypothetical protein
MRDLPRLTGEGRTIFALSRRVAGAQFNFAARLRTVIASHIWWRAPISRGWAGVQATLQKQFALLLIVTGGAVADGYIQSAGAQCAPGAKIYIDPRLVPQRQKVTREGFEGIMADPWTDPAVKVKKYFMESYYSQHQPIEVPFGGGRVLVSPDDPCVLQYIGP